MFWLIVLAAVVVLGGLAWWSSGRKRRKGVDDGAVERTRRTHEDHGKQYFGSDGMG